ncbi:hypothetical protein KSP40_PGU004724 [Platanthera guangdongensis]|uniref:Uncharacterized protein n=1 Tax=Platanthera guangdongensis TaxID=2320717 RepID=A0ABR2MLT4_9ASPA
MAVSGGRRRVGSMLPYLVKTLRKESTNPANQKLPSLRRMFSLYDQINLIDSVPEGELRFKCELVHPTSVPSQFAHQLHNHICSTRSKAWAKVTTAEKDIVELEPYSDTGFTVNDVKYEGSLLIVENKVLSWAPKRFSDINSERYANELLVDYTRCSLSIFQILRPIPEIPDRQSSVVRRCEPGVQSLDAMITTFSDRFYDCFAIFIRSRLRQSPCRSALPLTTSQATPPCSPPSSIVPRRGPSSKSQLQEMNTSLESTMFNIIEQLLCGVHLFLSLVALARENDLLLGMVAAVINRAFLPPQAQSPIHDIIPTNLGIVLGREAVVEFVRRLSEAFGFFQVVNHKIALFLHEDMLEELALKMKYYARVLSRKVLLNSNFDKFKSPMANRRDAFFCVMMREDPPSVRFS